MSCIALYSNLGVFISTSLFMHHENLYLDYDEKISNRIIHHDDVDCWARTWAPVLNVMCSVVASPVYLQGGARIAA